MAAWTDDGWDGINVRLSMEIQAQEASGHRKKMECNIIISDLLENVGRRERRSRILAIDHDVNVSTLCDPEWERLLIDSGRVPVFYIVSGHPEDIQGYLYFLKRV